MSIYLYTARIPPPSSKATYLLYRENECYHCLSFLNPHANVLQVREGKIFHCVQTTVHKVDPQFLNENIVENSL